MRGLVRALATTVGSKQKHSAQSFSEKNAMEKLREKVFARMEAGDSTAEISKAFGIARSTV